MSMFIENLIKALPQLLEIIIPLIFQANETHDKGKGEEKKTEVMNKALQHPNFPEEIKSHENGRGALSHLVDFSVGFMKKTNILKH